MCNTAYHEEVVSVGRGERGKRRMLHVLEGRKEVIMIARLYPHQTTAC